MQNKILMIISLLLSSVALAADQTIANTASTAPAATTTPAANAPTTQATSTTPATTTSTTPVVGNADAGKQKITVCATCHGVDGNSPIAVNPNLAGQHVEYLIRAMTEYQQGANGPRNNAIMAGMVAGLSAQDIADIAAYYSSQTEKVGEADPALVKLGEALYRGGDAERGIPACMACHGPVGQGNGPADFPKVANQNPDYVIAALKEYQSNTRVNAMMNDIANKMTDADMKAVATYIYGLYPAGMKLPEPTPAAASTTAAPASAVTETKPNDATTAPTASVNKTTPPAATAAPTATVTETKPNDATTAPTANVNETSPPAATSAPEATVNQTKPNDATSAPVTTTSTTK